MKFFSFLQYSALAGCLGLLAAEPAAAQSPTWRWAVAHQATGNNQSSIVDMALDGTGGAVVVGNFSGTITLGSTTLTSAGSQDVFVARLGSTGAWLQAVRGGGTGYDHATALALDATRTVTIGGYFMAAASTFGNTTLSNTDATGNTFDLFVARLSPSGTWTQALSAGNSGSEQVRDLAQDASGTVTVVGTFNTPPGSGTPSTVTFGSTTLTNGSLNFEDIFVARLGAAGTWTQAVGVGGNGMDYPTDVAVDAAGNATVVGAFSSSTLGFGPTTLSNASTGFFYTDLFVARLSSAGTWTQAVRAGGSGMDVAATVALDASGGVIVGGNFTSLAVGFGPVSLMNVDASGNTSDVFVGRLNAAGGWTQAVGVGGTGADQLQTSAVDAAGNVTVAGLFTGPSISFGATILGNANNSTVNQGSDVFVAQLTSAGNWSYAEGAGGIGSEEAGAVALDARGHVTVAGTISSASVRFGNFTIGTTAVSGFVARLEALATATATKSPRRPSLLLAPNPARGQVRVWSSYFSPGTLQVVEVFDCMGRLVAQHECASTGQGITFSVQGLQAGVYGVRIGTVTQRLVVE